MNPSTPKTAAQRRARDADLLVERARRGDPAAFDGLVRRFGQGRSRRQALRGLAGVAAGASALALSSGAHAQEATPVASPAAGASPMGTEIAWMPEWTFDEVIAQGNQAAARWTVRGTHTGDLLGFGATGKPVEFGVVLRRILAG